jgi:prohibitin 2
MNSLHYIKIKKGVTIIIVLIIIFSSFGIVNPGFRGVKLTFGAVSSETLGEGLYFKIPLAQQIVEMNVQNQKIEREADASSKDLQSVFATVALNYNIIHSKANIVYQTLRKDYEERVIVPSIEESVKAATALFTAEELITKRTEIREAITNLLIEKLEKEHFEVRSVNIVNFKFSESFDRAIEAKVTAEQQALKAQNDLGRIEFEADQRVTEAEGKAEALRVEAQALRNNSDILELRAIEKWNGVLPQVTSGAIPFINLD